MLLDTPHYHLDKPRYRQNMKNGVKGILIPSTQRNTIDNAQTLSQSYKGIFYSVGFHPKYAEKFEIAMLEEYVTDIRCIAIGEQRSINLLI